MRALLLTLMAVPCFAATPKSEILWDTYGVPHIFSADEESMFYAHGWAQAQNQANLLLHLYGESRGRGAEYWGESALTLDRWLQLNGVPDRARQWYAAQDPTFRKYLDAFSRGINDYAKAHPEAIAPENRVVLPVTGIDVIGHPLRVVHYMYMASEARMQRAIRAMNRGGIAELEPFDKPIDGSNTWAIGPSRSASGKPMLVINPHLAWGDTFYRYMEVHLASPGYDFYGAPQIGFAVPVAGFNTEAGWARTVNTIDSVDFFRLTVREGQYEFDGKLRPFEHETKTLRIRQPDGTFREEKLEVRRSVHGPVVSDANGVTVAMKVAGIDRPRMLEQWYRMTRARNLGEFQDALRIMAVPMWNANYAGSDGHILEVCDGLIPRKKTGDWKFWSGVVPGNTSETLWTDYLSYEELPKVLDSPSGFHQNTNEPPWWMTLPVLDAAKFAAWVAPPDLGTTLFRTKRSLHMITSEPKISYEQMTADKLSTRMEAADALLPDLLAAAKGSSDADVTEAAGVLERWDRMTDSGSRGAVLFKIFTDRYFGAGGNNMDGKLRVRLNPSDPVNSAYGIGDAAAALKALSAAAAECRKTYGALDVPWGDIYRFGSGTGDVPGNGGPGALGVFRTITYGRKVGDKYYASHGETFVCTVEFAAKQQAQCALSYGNSSQTGSPHLADQLALMSAKKLHPVWRSRKEIEAHLEGRQAF
jgi:acyl-homoserine-lactone acylase